MQSQLADSPAADMNGGSVFKLDGDIVTCDREVTVNTVDGPPFDHGEPRLHHKCHKLRGELISREGESNSLRINYPTCVWSACRRRCATA